MGRSHPHFPMTDVHGRNIVPTDTVICGKSGPIVKFEIVQFNPAESGIRAHPEILVI